MDDASNRVLIATGLSELEPPSKKKKTGKFSSENGGGVDDSRSNDNGWTLDHSEFPEFLDDLEFLLSQFVDISCSLSSENEGGVNDSGSNDDGWMPDNLHELGQLALFPMELEPPFSGKSSSENKGRLDDRRSNGDIWMTNKTGLLSPPPPHSLSLDLCLGTQAGLLSPPPPHSLSLDLRLGTYDSQVSIQYWNKLESNGSVDGENNHDNHVSSENKDRLLDCRRYDGLLLKLTLPMSSTETGKESNEINGIEGCTGKESNEINGVEGSCEVHPVAEKCPVRHPNAVQLLSASSNNSNCLDVNLRIEGRHPPPLLLRLRNMFSQPIHCPFAGTIFGNRKPENVLLIEQLFGVQLSSTENNPFLVTSTPEAEDMSSRLLEKNPKLRLEVREVLLHPFFWNSSEKLRFLLWINWRLRSKNLVPSLLEEFESNEPPVFNGKWIDQIDHKFKAEIVQRGDNYDYSSVMELLRFMRNKHAHRMELPGKLKKLVGWNDESFYNYFAARFPRLLVKSYGVASQFCRQEKWFKEFHRSVTSSKVLRKMPSDPLAAW